jgi:transposase
MPDLASAPSEAADALRALVRSLQEQLEQREREHARHARDLELRLLRAEQLLEWFRKRYYGPRADKLASERELGQMLLAFAEQLGPASPAADPSPTAGAEPAARRIVRRGGRRNLAAFEEIPARTIVHALSAQERACPGCGAERAEIGAEASWQLEYVPGHFERLQHLRMKYACRRCERQASPAHIAAAAKPAAAIERGLPGPGLLAFIATSKFADYLPLYRLEGIVERNGCAVSRATMSAWCGDVAELAAPLVELMAERVRQSHVIGTDDTPMPMQQPGAGRTRTARMWIYRGDANHPYHVFAFAESRKRDGPLAWLRGYNQVLVADAYGGYDGVVAGNAITRAGCWAHVRRKFVDAEKVAPEVAREAVAWIRALYAVEAQAAEAAPAARVALRQEQSAPVLAQLHQRLLAWRRELLPKHPAAEAVGYALNQWEELNVFLRDGAVPLDNNASEREIKRVVLNRKNSLFVGNPRGGRTAAILSSLTSTCKRHGVDPQLYLTQLLFNLPAWPMRELSAWLPDQWKLRQASLPQSPPPA